MNEHNQQPGSADLLTCPFCGGSAHFEQGGNGFLNLMVEHEKTCWMHGDVPEMSYHESANARESMTGKWNRRDAIAASRRAVNAPTLCRHCSANSFYDPNVDAMVCRVCGVARNNDSNLSAVQAAPSLPDVAMPEKDAKAAFKAAFLSWNGFHTDAELEKEWAYGTLAGEMFRSGLAAQPSEGSSQPFTVSMSRPATINWDGTPAEASAQVATEQITIESMEFHKLAMSYRGAWPSHVHSAYKELLAYIDSRIATGWVNVKDRVPEDCALVLVYDADHESKVWPAMWLAGSQTFESEVMGWLAKDEVSHWMPFILPHIDGDKQGAQGGGSE